MNDIITIDSRTANPYQVGLDLCEMAGWFNLTEEGKGNMTPKEAAADMAQWLTEQDVRLIDYDGGELNMAQYIERYLSQ